MCRPHGIRAIADNWWFNKFRKRLTDEQAADKFLKCHADYQNGLEEVIRRHVKKVFVKYAQNLSRASAALKISRNTLRKHVSEC